MPIAATCAAMGKSENRLHRVRDLTYREDACHLRTGTALPITLRNLATSAPRQTAAGVG
jgi:hypothetical protein